ncbi:MAG: endo alpha-1,4 polygalactosaminidase [Planctomycetota bacterium]
MKPPLSGLFAALSLVFLPACSSSSAHADPGASLQSVGSWMYQLIGLDTPAGMNALVASPFEMVVIDPIANVLGSESYDIAAEVARLQQSGKRVFAYVNIGEAEDWRSYWQAEWDLNLPSWIAGEDSGGWDGNYPVYFWNAEWQAILADSLAQVADWGFDGIFMDWVEIYEYDVVAQTAAAMNLDSEDLLVDYMGWIRSELDSLRPEMQMVAQNAAALGYRADYLSLVDAITQEAIWFDGSGDPDQSSVHGDVPQDPQDTTWILQDLALWRQAGKPVFHVEYCELPQNTTFAYEQGALRGFHTLCTLRLLDQITQTPPPGL